MFIQIKGILSETHHIQCLHLIESKMGAVDKLFSISSDLVIVTRLIVPSHDATVVCLIGDCKRMHATILGMWMEMMLVCGCILMQLYNNTEYM